MRVDLEMLPLFKEWENQICLLSNCWTNAILAEKNVTSRLIQNIQIDGMNHMNAEQWAEVKENYSKKLFCRYISYEFYEPCICKCCDSRFSIITTCSDHFFNNDTRGFRSLFRFHNLQCRRYHSLCDQCWCTLYCTGIF